ncbi:hypothetical protein UFOVP344_10 [uncultured Caudovirales phage]|uniref:Uncharacterized protein n=1 Tax=uncultured Caudovirales phage TaxID=2100421 RepID=A0A6J5LW29_9CAUD|nr:hypothetical protein UFOVP344_10 [uncultured Caudovirales phage]
MMVEPSREYIDSLWERRAEILDLLEDANGLDWTITDDELEAELDGIQEELFLIMTFLHTSAKAPKDA